MIDYINKDTDSCKYVETMKIFAHGLPSKFDFGLDGENRKSQQFTNEDVSEIEDREFTDNPEIYSYACRTGNTSSKEIFLEDWIDDVKPQESLAQKLADEHNATVYAYLRRTLYTPTFYDKGDKEYQKKYIQIEDESVNGMFWRPHKWDEALWNPEGAYASPTFDNSPLGIPEEMYIFEKDKKPRPKK